MQSNILQKTQSQIVVSDNQQQFQRTQPIFQIRKTAPRHLNYTHIQASTSQLRSPKYRFNSANMMRNQISHKRVPTAPTFKLGEVTRALSARKPNNVPAIRINFDRIDTSPEQAMNHKTNKADTARMLKLSSRNDKNKPRKSSLLMVNPDIISTNFSSRRSSNISNYNLSLRSSRRSSRNSTGRSDNSKNSAAGKGPTINIFKEIGNSIQDIRPDPIKVAQRELEAQQEDYRSNVLLDFDRSNIRTSASLNRAIQTDKEVTKSIEASQMLNKLYKSQIDGFNKICEDRLNSPEVKNESC